MILYIRKLTDGMVKICCGVDVVTATASQVVFQSQEYLVVSTDISYFLPRKERPGTVSLYQVFFPASQKEGPPYTYKGQVLEKLRDVPQEWEEDE